MLHNPTAYSTSKHSLWQLPNFLHFPTFKIFTKNNLECKATHKVGRPRRWQDSIDTLLLSLSLSGASTGIAHSSQNERELRGLGGWGRKASGWRTKAFQDSDRQGFDNVRVRIFDAVRWWSASTRDSLRSTKTKPWASLESIYKVVGSMCVVIYHALPWEKAYRTHLQVIWGIRSKKLPLDFTTRCLAEPLNHRCGREVLAQAPKNEEKHTFCKRGALMSHWPTVS